MSIEENKAIVRRLIEARNAWRLDLLDELVAAECMPHAFSSSERPEPSPAGRRGPEAWKTTLRGWQERMPDSHVTVEGCVAEGDQVMQIELVEGTHTGPMWGLPPTGKRVAFRGVRVYTVQDGKIAGYGNLWDYLGLFQQLGVLPPTPELIAAAATR